MTDTNGSCAPEDNVQLQRRHPLAECENCTLKTPDCQPVYTSGPEDSTTIIIGEAPGYNETRTQEAFTGISGELLNRVLSHVGIDRNTCKVTNACLCRPPDNRTPNKSEIAACRPRLLADVEGTTTVISLGATAATSLAGSPVKITQFRAGPPKDLDGKKWIATIHPANCLRTPDNFPHLVADLEKVNAVTIKVEPPTYKVIDDADTALKAFRELRERTDRLVIDIETAFDKDVSFEHPNHSELLCIGIGYGPGKVIVVERNALQHKAVTTELGRLLASKKVIAHNGKFDIKALLKYNSSIRLWFDTMLASYVLDERGGTHGLKYLAKELLGAPDWDSELKKYKTWAEIPPDILDKYNAYDVSCTWDLYERFQAQLHVDLDQRDLHDFLVKASNVLMFSEMRGINIDAERMQIVGDRTKQDLDKLDEALQKFVKNPRSPKQIKEALSFLEIDTESTDKDHIKEIMDATTDSNVFTFCTLLLEYRNLQKLYGTYIKGLDSRTFEGRVYPNFLLHGTTTGRLSCRNPNLQNIPRGSSIKSLFVPTEGNTFVQADYSQLEYRVVTTLAQEPFLAEIFRDPSRDVFGELASSMFGVDWTKAHRQIVKRVVHGSNYGMGKVKMAEQINADAFQMGVTGDYTPQQAAAFQQQYFANIPKVREWQKQTTVDLKKAGELVTAFGRHRRFPLITNDNKHDVEKEGLAFVPQSTGSDICLSALITLATEHGLDIKLPVHDSIMVECDGADAADVARTMEKVMMQAATDWNNYVPFSVEVKQSNDSWGEL